MNHTSVLFKCVYTVCVCVCVCMCAHVHMCTIDNKAIHQIKLYILGIENHQEQSGHFSKVV